MKVARSQRLDDIDARRMRDMVDSAPFQVLTGRVKSELDRAAASCERSDNTVEIFRSQGAAGALRAVLALPDLILKEIARNGRIE